MLDVSDVLASFRLERPLGRGGMGVVYRARDERLGRWVALKVIAPELAYEESFRERFERECRLAAAIDHPNVIPIYGAGEAGGRLFLAMRLVDGTDLRTLIVSEQRLAPARAVAIVAQVASALDAAHADGLVHRDVKPQNVLIVDPGGAEHVYLTDFGLARLAEESSALTASGDWVGTPDYVAPEQLRGGRVDRRADVYALGCLLFEALTGRVPFGGNPAAKLLAHVSALPPCVTAEVADSPPGLDEVIARALAKQPEQRYATAGELAAAAHAALEEAPTRSAHDPDAVTTDGRGGAAPAPLQRSAASPIPELATRTFGRDDDVRIVASLLKRPEVRCLTLTGTGGVGKTRLALEVTRAVATSFSDGARFVSLAGVSDPARVPDSLAQQLGVRSEGDEAATAIARFLAVKQLLLVLDNFEHVLAAAPLVEEIRSRCSGVKVLATSREPLRLASEHVHRVEPLVLPRRGDDLAEVSRAPASALFIDRASAQDPGFHLTPADAQALSQICRRLDGVPLALELAAARTSLLSPGELLERLGPAVTTLGGGPRDAPARQRTLRATIDWSYNLLEEEEQAAFVGLAVFAGGADLEAIETVTGATVGTLAALVAKNLAVRRQHRDGRTRVYLLETIREYAAERLEQRDDASPVRARHCEYYVELVERAKLGLRSREQQSWARCLDDELDNLRAAMAWSLREGLPELPARLAGALGFFLSWRRGRPAEARDWLEAALNAAHRLPRHVRARACLELACALREMGEMEPARRRCREAVRLYRMAGDTAGLAESVADLSFIEFSAGDSDRAAATAAKGLKLARASGDRWVTAFALCPTFFDATPGLAPEKARADEAIAIARELEDHNLLAMLHSNIGFAALEEGDCEYAWQATTEAVALHRTVVDDVGGFVVSLCNLGLVAALDGKDQEAETALREALQTCFEHGMVRPVSEVLVAMAVLASRASDHVRAARLCGAAGALIVEPSSQTEEELHAEARESARRVLGDEGWRREWESGHGLAFEDAIAYALADLHSVDTSDTATPAGDRDAAGVLRPA